LGVRGRILPLFLALHNLVKPKDEIHGIKKMAIKKSNFRKIN